MAKITFGYVSKANPFIDRKAWSGTIFKIRESIEQAGYTVRWIPYTTPFFSKFILGLYHLYAKLTGKNIVYSHIPLIARMEAHSIDKKTDCRMRHAVFQRRLPGAVPDRNG